MTHTLPRAVATAAICLFSAAAMAQSDVPVTLRFAGEVNGTPFSCGTAYEGIGSPPATITPTDYRFYVTDVELLDKEGQATPVAMTDRALWQADGIALIDFEDGSGPCEGGNTALNAVVEGSAPAGDYTGLRFTMGMPFDVAHGDITIASAPLDISAMFWGWQMGYRYLKVDMTGEMTGGHSGRPTGFSVHVGDTGCQGPSFSQRPTSCAQVNTVAVTFDAFDATRNEVVADLGRLLATTDTSTNAPDTAPGCMAEGNDPDCAGIFSALGLAFGTGKVVPQTFFASR